jgi:hypothetical protein
MLAGRPAPAAQHGRGGHEHEPGEQAEQQAGLDAGGQPGAGVGSGHAEDTEGDARREADSAGPLVGDHPGGRRDPHDQQRPGRDGDGQQASLLLTYPYRYVMRPG